LLIALIGIPHGAVDHILFLKKTNHSPLFFYTFYLLLILVYVAGWIIFPQLSLSFFLLLSAYHFGQSQMQYYKALPNRIRKVISTCWGITVLSSFVVIHFDQIVDLMNEQSDFNVFTALFDYNVFLITMCISSVMLVAICIYYRHQINQLKELLYFLLIIATFLWQSPFIGFALFFVFNHSLEVLQSEHSFLSQVKKNFNLIEFIKDLAPFTLLSLFGMAFFYLLSAIELLELSLPLLILISISSLTLTHAVVMEVFYRRSN
jgi:Brp/Blh family beta-carotene 15,15'-monooxygenase